MPGVKLVPIVALSFLTAAVSGQSAIDTDAAVVLFLTDAAITTKNIPSGSVLTAHKGTSNTECFLKSAGEPPQYAIKIRPGENTGTIAIAFLKFIKPNETEFETRVRGVFPQKVPIPKMETIIDWCNQTPAPQFIMPNRPLPKKQKTN